MPCILDIKINVVIGYHNLRGGGGKAFTLQQTRELTS